MNIHRKDKAKARAKPKNYPTPTLSSYSSVSYKNNHDNDQASAYSPALNLAPQRNNQAYNYNYNYSNPPTNNNPRPLSYSPSQPSIYFRNENYTVGRSGLFGMYEEPPGADLSLNGTHEETSNKKKDNEGNYDVIDLELRLGYDP